MTHTSPNVQSLFSLIRQSAITSGVAEQVGKKLPDALYVHVSALPHCHPDLQAYEAHARALLPPDCLFTLVKFAYYRPLVSYLYYPDFDTDPHPALQASTQVNLDTRTVRDRSYHTASNPPILHRKETFLAPNDPRYAQFAALTAAEEAAGLFTETSRIGTREGWQRRLQECGLRLDGHRLGWVDSGSSDRQASPPAVDRHRAAIQRNALSKPVRIAIEAGLLAPETPFFDYGCGRGGDVARLAAQGFVSQGWDPHYCPEAPQVAADIVNLGYVLNVIEDPAERRQTLCQAWKLCHRLLIVSAQVLVASGDGYVTYGDGILTTRNTFQKYYEQEELKHYIDTTLGVDAVPVALGIFFVFRDESQAQSFRASRFRSRATTPRVQLSTQRFEEHRALLSPLMDFFTEQGRLPVAEELLPFEALIGHFGTVQRAFRLIVQATNQAVWDAIADRRRQDILVFLALSNFDNLYHRPKLGALPLGLQRDIKALFGSYQAACTTADLMLFELGRPGFVDTCCNRSSLGWRSDRALYVHVSALASLDPLLRLYEGCASRTFGRMDTATVVKFHRQRPRIEYLFCPDFDKEPHPIVRSAMQVDLRDVRVRWRDYSQTDDPPVLHCKDACVLPDYPLYAKFARLTAQETKWGLLEKLNECSRLRAWQQHLVVSGVDYRGHRPIHRAQSSNL